MGKCRDRYFRASLLLRATACAVGAFACGGAALAVEPGQTGTVLVSTRCDVAPTDFGLESLGTFSLPANPKLAGAPLHALVVRVGPLTQASESLGAGASRLNYRDFVLVYHQAREGVQEALNGALAGLQGQGRIESMWGCRFAEGPDQVTLYKPFFTIEDAGMVHVAANLLVFSRSVAVAANASDFAQVEPTADALSELILSLDEPVADLPALPGLGEEPQVAGLPQEAPLPPAEVEEPAAVIRNYYGWVVALDFTAPAPGEKVFVPDRVDCGKTSNFIVGSVGRIAAPEQHEASGAEVAAVIRDEMIAANLYFGASGDPTDEKTVAASVDDTSYWCIPKRETCYQTVEFGDFQVRARAGDIDEFPRQNVISLRHGLPNALERVVMDSCPQQAIAKGT